MDPTRQVPAVGGDGEVIFLGATQPAKVVAVDGPTISVLSDDGEELVFELNRLTGHWVRSGHPYWGTRFRLRQALG